MPTPCEQFQQSSSPGYSQDFPPDQPDNMPGVHPGSCPGGRVTNSGLDPISTSSNYWSAAHQDALFDLYLLYPQYYSDMGRIQMPVTGLATVPQVGASGSAFNANGTERTPVSSEILQAEAPFGRMVLGWVARRFGIPPTVPDPRPPSQATNFVLMRYAILPPSPVLGSDGKTFTWVAGGVYDYALLVPVTPSDGYPVGASPYHTIPAGSMVFGASNFVNTIFGL